MWILVVREKHRAFPALGVYESKRAACDAAIRHVGADAQLSVTTRSLGEVLGSFLESRSEDLRINCVHCMIRVAKAKLGARCTTPRYQKLQRDLLELENSD